MAEKSWLNLGLTDDVLTELYRRGREYAERRIVLQHREDAVQHAMCQILSIVRDPTENYPEGREERLKYLTKSLFREARHFITRKLSPDTNIPTIPE